MFSFCEPSVCVHGFDGSGGAMIIKSLINVCEIVSCFSFLVFLLAFSFSNSEASCNGFSSWDQ